MFNHQTTIESEKQPKLNYTADHKDKLAVDIKTSYTAADSIPLKVLLDKELVSYAQTYGRLLPVHVQILPTNKCNLKCSFCSCSERNKNLEIDIGLAKMIIDRCKRLGTKSVTITGGGEPLLYSQFDELIDCFAEKNIKIGLVTNGILLHKANISSLNKITWCRISNGDDRYFGGAYKANLAKIVNSASNVDWAFSHVVSNKSNYEEIERIIDFANEYNFTHVRLVADLFHPKAVDMELIKEYLYQKGVDDTNVVYQGRKAYSRGGDCYIGYLKPLIGPDAKVYACCGVQYALEEPSKDLPEELCLGNAITIDKIIERSNTPLDGKICAKCYYMNYNILLKGMLKEVVHKEFV
ncbi:MAG: radical SAM protein [Nitrospirae bacterium]|nr:radical SAM protein [Nitrospirota bacterium]